MDIKSKYIIDEYRDGIQKYEELEELVSKMLRSALDDAGLKVMNIEHRVKSESSLMGKLEAKGDKYRSLADVTDILGVRIVCYFHDEVDKVAETVRKIFYIDPDNSVDKRKNDDPNYFGYRSLHYICALQDVGIYPKELCDIRFEVQIRSSLQHAWAAINHDLGYKTEYGVPRAVAHDFSKVASLLEIADEQFVYIRDNVARYGSEIRQKICDGTAHDVPIDSVSLSEYVKNNQLIGKLNKEIADLCSAQIHFSSPENYVKQLQFFGKANIGHLQEMVEKNYDLALKIADFALKGTEPEILSSNAALRFVCRAELLINTYSRDMAARFINLSMGDMQRARKTAGELFDFYEKLNEEG